MIFQHFVIPPLILQTSSNFRNARCQPARSGLESETVREVKTFQTLMLMITESNLNDHRLKSQRNTFQCQVKEAKRKIHS